MMSFPSRLGAHAAYLGRMMRTCGVDPVRFSHDRLGLSFSAVARACMVCERTQECRDWLQGADPERVHEPPGFCPNAERFRQARRG
jgi:hypothetical protein